MSNSEVVNAQSEYKSCSATTSNGHRCTRRVPSGGQYCWQHEPKNRRWIKRISLFGIITFLLAVIGFLADLAGLGLWPHPPDRMVGDFRIAVAGMAVDSPSDSPTFGEELSQGIYLQLRQVFDEQTTGLNVAIWGPEQVGIIRGRTATERALAAQKLADKIGADVVVYGFIERNDTHWRITPEFYVSTENFYEAEELVGEHSLGNSIEVSLQSRIATRLETSSQVGTRTHVLSTIILGLAFYSIEDYDQAMEVMDTLVVPEKPTSRGYEVGYLLIGHIALKSHDFVMAEEYYKKSSALDPDYSRPYIGLGNVYYLQALEPFNDSLNPSDIDVEMLHRSIDNYIQASKASYQPVLANVETKVHFGLGQCYFALTYSGKQDVRLQARDELLAVIEAYQDGANPRIREYAAEAYARLALLDVLQRDLVSGAANYRKAASTLPSNSDRREMYLDRAANLEIAAELMTR